MNGKSKRRLGLAALALFLGCEERVVSPADIARVDLEPEILTLRVGETSRFQATLYDSEGNALTGRDLSWSIDDGQVGTVAGNGTVIATGIGETRVVARAGGQQGAATLRVTSNTVASVEVVPAEAALELGAMREFDIVVTATDGTTLTDRVATWTSSTPAIATVDGQGMVKGVGLGSTTIVATVDEVPGEASVAVVAPTLSALRVDPAAATLQVGQQRQLTAVGLREGGGEVTGLPVAWRSLDANIATVDDNGIVTAVAEGAVRIEAGFGRLIGAATITVSPIPAASIDVQPEAPAIFVNDTLRMVATVRAADGTVLARSPAWSSTQAGVASVDASGLVRGVSSGFAYVTATLDGARDSALVRVSQRPVAAVVVRPAESTLTIGGTVQLTAQVISDDGSTQTREIVWSSSDTDVATVNGSGFVTARATGVAVIRATAGGVTGTAIVNVDAQPIVSLEVQPAAVELVTGETATFTAVGRTASGAEVTDVAVSWRSSNILVATVNSSGTATALLPGTARIIASAQGIEDTATVTVVPPPITSLEVRPSTLELETGGTGTLSAIGLRADGEEVTGLPVTWSTGDAAVATVSTAGTVTAQGPGTTDISASYQGLTASATVTVTASATEPATVSISGSDFTLQVGDEQQLSATVRNAAGDVIADASVSWSSKNGGVASVSDQGLVQANATGNTYIVAVAGSARDSVQVTVIPVAVARVVVAPSSATIEEDESIRLTATVYDANDNVLERTVVWSTNANNIVTVTQNGTVTGKREGVAIVTASVEGRSGSATIRVVDEVPELL